MDSLDLELSVSPEEMCRTCLAAVDCTQLKPIFCSEILDGKIVPFPKVIERVTGAKLTKHEKLPNNVCMECKVKLREFYIFVEKVRQSANLLYEIFSVVKPEEPPSPQSRRKVDTKAVEVQTDSSDCSKDKDDHPASSICLIEKGTQCDLARRTLGSSPAACQTDPLPEKSAGKEVQVKRLKKVDNVEKVPIIQIKKESFANVAISATVEPDVDSESLINDDANEGDEGEYDMILVAEEATAEECYTLSTVNLAPSRGTHSRGTRSSRLAASQPGSAVTTVAKASTVVKQQDQQKQPCEYCNFSYRPESLADHFQIHRQTLELCLESIDYYRCTICFVIFISRTHFDAHFNTACQPVLPDEFIEHSDVKKHERFYLSGLDVCLPKLKTFILSAEDDNYRCARCPMYSESFEEMRNHVQSHDAEDDQTDEVNLLWKENNLDKIHVCGLCQAQFPDALYIRQHLYFHQFSFFCPYECHVSFEKFVNLTRHIQRTHLQDVKPSPPRASDEEVKFRCARCGRHFPSPEVLEAHEKRHFRERKYVCTVCKKCFAQKSDLTTHVRIHTDERPFSCDLCGKTFRTTSHRRDHMSTHEIMNKYQCDVCQKLFKAERILIGHKRLHTGEKPFQCTVCDKSFSRKQHLKLHTNVHLKVEKA